MSKQQIRQVAVSPSSPQFLKYILAACEPAAEDELFMSAAGALGREAAAWKPQERPEILSAVEKFAVAAANRFAADQVIDAPGLIRLAPLLLQIAPDCPWRRDPRPLEAARRRVSEVLALSGRLDDVEQRRQLWAGEGRRRLMERLFVEALHVGEKPGLRQFALTLARLDAPVFSDEAAEDLATALTEGGWFEAIGAAGVDLIGEALAREALALRHLGLRQLMRAVGYSSWQAADHVEGLRGLFLPLCERAFELGANDLALPVLQALWRTEPAIAGGGATPAGLVELAERAALAGRRLGALLGRPPVEAAGSMRVALVVDASTSPAILRQLSGLGAELAEVGGNHARFYVLGAWSEGLEASIGSADAWWSCRVAGEASPPTAELADLRGQLRQDSVQTIVWAADPMLGCFALAAQLSALQFILTEPPLELGPEAFAAQPLAFVLGDGACKRGSGALPWAREPVVEGDHSASDEARSAVALPGSVLIGAIVEDARGWSEPFVSLVADVLALRPNAVFVWSSDSSPAPALRRLGVDRRLAERFRRLPLEVEGFVRAVDILLEPPGFGAADAAVAAMAAGAPVLAPAGSRSLFARALAEHASQATIIDRWRAAGHEEFVERLLALIDDPRLRHELGQALRRTCREALSAQAPDRAQTFLRLTKEGPRAGPRPDRSPTARAAQ